MNIPDFMELDSDGEIRLKGHRIRLIDVAKRYDEGHSVEAIAHVLYPTLTLASVHRTVAFYLEHQDDVRRLIAQNDEVMRQLEARPQTTPTFAELCRRMEEKRRQASSSDQVSGT